MHKHSRLFIAGASGLVGNTLVRQLQTNGYTNISGTYHSRPADYGSDVPMYKVDFRDQDAVAKLFEEAN